MTPQQAVGWGVAFVIILILIFLFFRYGRQVRPILGVHTAGAWLTNWS